jgi:cold shock CspA family protein
LTGYLKFFNEEKNFGFLVADFDGKDVFYHYDDMGKTKISKEFLREAKNHFTVRF